MGRFKIQPHKPGNEMFGAPIRFMAIHAGMAK